MPVYEVEYTHLVEIKYQARTIADSEEEAMENIENGDFIDEHECDWQGIEIIPKWAYRLEDEDV